MTFAQYLHEIGIDYRRALALSIGTDGLGKEANLMSVSVTAKVMDKGKVVPGTEVMDVGTRYVRGADAAKVSEFTGVSLDRYVAHALPQPEVLAELMAAVNQSSMLVIYSAKFTWVRLIHVFPELMGRPFIDVMPMAKFLDNRMPRPQGIKTVMELQSRLEAATSYIRGGYSMDDLCTRCISGYTGDTMDARFSTETPKLERQVYRLYALWQALLEKGD